jgi:hypothetical protein
LFNEGDHVMAVAAKGAAAADNPGMGKDDLKKNIKLSKRRHINVALALGGDGKAIIVMDKMKRGQPLSADLHKKAKDAKSPRWGVIEVDKEDPKRCIFILNKGGGGFARKLILALKGTGYNKVTIKLEDGSVDEDEAGEDDGVSTDDDGDQDDDDDADEQTASAKPAADDETEQTSASSDSDQDTQQTQGQDSGDGGDSGGDTDTQQTSASGDQDGQQNGQLDAGTLTKQLTTLIGQMVKAIGSDPTQKVALTQLAVSARESLKQGDLQGASAAMDNLKSAMGQGGGSSNGSGDQSSAQPTDSDGSAQASNGSAQPDSTDTSNQADASSGDDGSDGSTQSNGSAQPDQSGDDDSLDASHQAKAPAIAKAKTAWNATLQKVEGDLGKLHNAFGGAFKGHDQEQEISKAFKSKVDGVLQSFDKELSEVLESVNKARGRREREEMVKRAHAILAQHRQRVTSDQTIVQIDANPFVSLSIGKTMSTTIDALTRAIS